MNILADASLPGLHEAFPKPFVLSLYTHPDEIPLLLDNQDILLCRATLKVNHSLLKDHQLKFVATASSGTDHLDHTYLKSRAIKIIDAKGCNAVSVADYVVSSIAYLNQQKLIKGTTAGIIGVGQVGTKVFRRLDALNFKIYTYDPLKAERDKHFLSCELDQLSECDLLCIHAELHRSPPHPSYDLINHEFLNQLKPGCVIINASRGGIVNEHALVNSRQPLVYCTDVYNNEPAIDQRIIEKATLCTPHIAGHSLEAKFTAVALVSEQLHKLVKLPIPVFAKPELSKESTFNRGKSWQELILSLYNPSIETRELKEADDKESAFKLLRKQHQYRHDFSIYLNLMPPETSSSLGSSLKESIID